MNTNEIRKITGLSVQMIHFYEKKKIIKPVRNESNGYRNFTSEDEFRIVIAHTLNSMGIALDDVCQIMDGSNYDEKISMLQDRIAVMKKKENCLISSWNWQGNWRILLKLSVPERLIF